MSILVYGSSNNESVWNSLIMFCSAICYYIKHPQPNPPSPSPRKKPERGGEKPKEILAGRGR